MSFHPIKEIIQACDKAISAKNYDELMQYYAEGATLVVKPGMVVSGKDNIRKAFIAISDHFQDQLTVEQGEILVIEGARNALVIMETVLSFPDGQGGIAQLTRRATYVFQYEQEKWLCAVDNSYGTDLLDAVELF